MSQEELISHLGVLPDVWRKGIQESVIEYAPGGSSGVSSVNGKLGNVELTAEDVGALSNTTEIPTVDVNKSYVDDRDNLKLNISDAFTKSNADNYYQPKGDYALLGDVYTKVQSDNRYMFKDGTVDLTNQPISNINGLQSALDSKANQSTTYTKTEVDSSLNSKANAIHTHSILDITNLQTTLDAKASLVHTHAIADTTNLQSTLDSKISNTRIFQQHVFLTKTGLSNVINAGSAFNLFTLFVQADLTGDTAGLTLASGNLKFATQNNATEVCNITIKVRLTGTLSGAAGTQREFFVELRRVDGTTLLERTSIIKIIDGNLNQRNCLIDSYYRGNNDPFVTNGCTLFLNNPVGSGSNITLTDCYISVKRSY